MKYNRTLYVSTLIFFTMTLWGCKKEKFNINTNPDDVTDNSVTAPVLIPAAQQATATLIAANYWWVSWWMGHGARSGSYQSLNNEETYTVTQSYHNEMWNDLFNNANNYTIALNKAKASGQGIYEAIARIMRAHCFQMLVDVYGNIPYTETFQGTVIATPKYDKAVDIYKDLFNQLDTAVALLQNEEATAATNNPDIEAADLIYGGDLENWIKLANTLRLRLIVHLHNGLETTQVVSGISISEQIGKITDDGFIGAGEDAQINPGFSGSKPQPYYRFYNTNESGSGSQRDQLRASEYAIKYYSLNGDPRINKFYVAPASGHKGIPFGTPSGAGVPLGSDLSTVRGTGLSPDAAASKAWIFTATESLFLQAEARHRGILATGETASELFTAAVTESFEWLGLDASDAAEYLEANEGYGDADYNAADGGIVAILSQKWFALNSIAPHEIWTDYRRSDIKYGIVSGYTAGPTLSVDPNNNATSIPVRLTYPQNEYNYNAKNVGAEGTVNVFTSRIFWDLN